MHVHGGGWRRGSRREPLPGPDPGFYESLAAGGVPDAGPDSREAQLLGAPAQSVPDLAAELELVPGATHMWHGASDVAGIVRRSAGFLRALG